MNGGRGGGICKDTHAHTHKIILLLCSHTPTHILLFLQSSKELYFNIELIESVTPVMTNNNNNNK